MTAAPRRRRRLWPGGLAGRFALLLAAALVAANLVALALMSSERQRIGREMIEGREIERLAELAPAIEAAAPADRSRIARAASGRFARVSVGPEPAVADPGAGDARSVALARRLAAELDPAPAELRVAIGEARGPRGGEAIAVSIRLATAEGAPPEWLNVAARAWSPPPPHGDVRPSLLALGASFVAVLAVGLGFIRRLTRPLAGLAEAARAAGRGDRGARAPETGPRELLEAARAFNEMQARIARFDAERMRMLGAVGHDLRTPITSLRIRAEMLDEPERAPMVRTLDEMAVMADGLVAFARGQGDAEAVAEVDLAALLARLCVGRGATLAAPTPRATVRGRAVALTRALGNLVDNALRYGGAARVRLAVADGAATVAVEDDGPGIAPERIETMFEPFVRGEASRSLETGGAGLGLSIARSILRAHGGELALRNREDGEGLVATATLPLAGDEG